MMNSFPFLPLIVRAVLSVLLFPSLGQGQDSAKNLLRIVPAPEQDPAVQLGFEWGSLYQEGFRNIGRKNFSYLLGYRGGAGKMDGFGFRLMGVHVRLTPARARNHQGLHLIDNPSAGLEGAIHADRVYFDTYPLRFGILPWKDAHYVFRGGIGVSPGLGYNAWRVRPSNNNTEYSLEALSFGLAVRARLRIMEHLFIEYPFFELFTYLYRAPPPKGSARQRISSDPFGLFSWGTIGLSFPLKGSGEDGKERGSGP